MPKTGSATSAALASPSARVAKRVLTQAFIEADIPYAEEDALEIILAATGLDKTALILKGTDPLPIEEYIVIESYMARRLLGEPVDHILGWREFFGRRFHISADVLSPRADTETLIRGTLKRLNASTQTHILDLGTGSGAIGLTMLAEVPQTNLTATDISNAALAIARKNAETLGLLERARFRQGEWWSAVSPKSVFDMILSNPPYISDAAMETLDVEVSNYDPDIALRGGVDGLDPYHIIIAGAAAHLKSGGWLGLEIGFDQAGALKNLLEAGPWRNIRVDKDLGGLDRAVWAQNSAEN